MKKISIILSIIICVISILITAKAETISKYRIIIDPGHGGRDGGATANQIEEATLNLEISLKLKKIFELNGFDVDMTRQDSRDLCDESAFVKREDMNKRVKMINSGDYLFCISIHQNTYPNVIYRGAQTFYNDINPLNKELALNIQNGLKYFLNNTTREIVKRTNVYLLNKVTIPIVIVECGFITNPEESKLLKDNDYQKQLAYSIYYGSIKTMSFS